jgi:hypothetical protein
MKSVFISHASADAAAAKEIAGLLEQRGLECIIDLAVLQAGDNFISFMEASLASADYCLLLWSRPAFESQWVQAEWHAALARSVLERCAFLFTIRLEDLPVPRLLAPRLWIDFFPVLAAGVEVLLQKLHMDEIAVATSNKEIGAPRVGLPEPTAGASLYVSSDLFDIVMPTNAQLSMPVGALLTSTLQWLSLPSHQQLDPRGRLSVKMSYELAVGTTVLPRNQTLLQAGVREGDVLQLMTYCEIISATEPVSGGSGKLAFRSFRTDETSQTVPLAANSEIALARAKSAFRNVLIRNGLLRPSP